MMTEGPSFSQVLEVHDQQFYLRNHNPVLQSQNIIRSLDLDALTLGRISKAERNTNMIILHYQNIFRNEKHLVEGVPQ